MTTQEKMADLESQLQRLTLGGSEFHGDPVRCIAWIRDRLSGPFVSVKTENENLQIQLAAATEDTARLDWLDALSQNGKGPVVLDAALGASTLRQAIDAAREAVK